MRRDEDVSPLADDESHDYSGVAAAAFVPASRLVKPEGKPVGPVVKQRAFVPPAPAVKQQVKVEKSMVKEERLGVKEERRSSQSREREEIDLLSDDDAAPLKAEGGPVGMDVEPGDSASWSLPSLEGPKGQAVTDKRASLAPVA